VSKDEVVVHRRPDLADWVGSLLCINVPMMVEKGAEPVVAHRLIFALDRAKVERSAMNTLSPAVR